MRRTALPRLRIPACATMWPVVVDVTPGRPPRLLDVLDGRSGKIYADWLAARDQQMAGPRRRRRARPVPRVLDRVERVALKQRVFRDLDRLADADVILATTALIGPRGGELAGPVVPHPENHRCAHHRERPMLADPPPIRASFRSPCASLASTPAPIHLAAGPTAQLSGSSRSLPSLLRAPHLVASSQRPVDGIQARR